MECTHLKSPQFSFLRILRQGNPFLNTDFTVSGTLRIILLTIVILFSGSAGVMGWDYTRHSIPLKEIQSGGPPIDAIPALFDPEFVKVDKTAFMRDDEKVLGVFLNGIARAFPTRIMSWHELVNLNFGDLPVLVSW
jgi:hypothetical protein